MTEPLLFSMDECSSDFATNPEFFLKKEDRGIFDVVFECYGAIFGKYLRDCCAKETPDNINVVMSTMYKDEFVYNISKLYKYSLYDWLTDTHLFFGDHNRLIEINYVDDDPHDNIIVPPNKPDFDVNLLRYCHKYGLTAWSNQNLNINEIITNIERRECFQQHDNISDGSIIGIIKKGYNIIN